MVAAGRGWLPPLLLAFPFAALAAACDDSSDPEPIELRSAPPGAVRPLPAPELLTRISLDLRGVRPSAADLEAVEADPAALDARIDAYLESDAFGARVRALFEPVYRTQIDSYPIGPVHYGLENTPERRAAFARSVGDEPLRLLEHIARNDLPYTELVTADYSMADPLLLEIWPLEPIADNADNADGPGDGWRKARYTDGRQMAGVLSGNTLYWRYPSNGVNYHRQRANALSRILLCNDYLDRPVDFPRDIDLGDDEVVREAVKGNTGCVNCHVSLDPFASFLFGFSYAGATAAEMTSYHPERERRWQAATGTAPGFYGKVGYTLGDLGESIAADPRFVSCAVETVYAGLLGRELTLDDTDALTRHREAFLESGLQLRALVRSVLSEPRYRGGYATEIGGVPIKVVSPELLASQLEALTGYRFTAGGVDVLGSANLGLKALAGGGDGFGGGVGTSPPTATMLLSQERVAEAAAWAAVEREARGAAENPLFVEVDLAAVPSDTALKAQLSHFHRALFGRSRGAEHEAIVAGAELFQDLLQVEGDPQRAWVGVLTVLLRDPEFVTY